MLSGVRKHFTLCAKRPQKEHCWEVSMLMDLLFSPHVDVPFTSMPEPNAKCGHFVRHLWLKLHFHLGLFNLKLISFAFPDFRLVCDSYHSSPLPSNHLLCQLPVQSQPPPADVLESVRGDGEGATGADFPAVCHQAEREKPEVLFWKQGTRTHFPASFPGMGRCFPALLFQQQQTAL